MEIDPNNALTWYYKGEALFTSGKVKEGIEYFDRAFRTDPNFVINKLGKKD